MKMAFCKKCTTFFLLAALLVLVAACATPQSPAETVFQAKTAHAVALRTAVAYRELPPCSKAAMPCHDPAIVAQLQRADKVADAALDAAENAVRTPGFGTEIVASTVASAKAALAAFTSITSTLRTK